jgi:hypothetical protein
LTGSAWPAPPGAISAVVQSGVTAISDLVDTARTEESLLRAQSELRFFAKLVKFELCAYGVLTDLQRRFVAVTSKLVLDDGIPVTFESNLLADWSIAAGSDLDKALERRVYEHTMASIAARDPRDAPSWIVRERLSRHLLRHPEAQAEALVRVVSYDHLLSDCQDERQRLEGVQQGIAPRRWLRAPGHDSLIADLLSRGGCVEHGADEQ